MANWRKLTIATLLADSKIDDDEVKALRKELWEDGQIDMEEVKFLIDLRNNAAEKGQSEERRSESEIHGTLLQGH